MIDYKSIKVKCRNCGKEAAADSFVLDYVYRMMVCPQCVKDRQHREIIHKEAKKQAEEEARKPAGWDKDDEYLEKAYAEKMTKKIPIVEISEGKFRYRCPKCKYEFVYNKITKTPTTCPYCGAEIYSL